MYQIAVDSPAAQAAKRKLLAKLNVGEQARDDILRKTSEMVITDIMLTPGKFNVRAADNKLYILPNAQEDYSRVHPHALGQVCDRANPSIPRQFIRKLLEGGTWEQELAQHNINTVYNRGIYLLRNKREAKFMGRFVGAGIRRELRGFVSQYFPRHLASKPMFRGFVFVCQQLGAHPIDGRASDLRFSLKCALPHVFEPVPGEFFGFGVELSNSDFATALLCVRFFTYYLKCGTCAVLDKSWAKKHLGSVVKESDLLLGPEARAKDTDAVVAAMSDSVKQVLSYENVNKMLTVIEHAHKERVPWHRIEKEMGRILRKAELEEVKKVLDGTAEAEVLPPVDVDDDGNPIPSRWWMSEVAGFMATKEINPERATELEKLSGSVLKAS